MTNKSDQRKSSNNAVNDSGSDIASRFHIISAILIERLRKQDITWVRIADNESVSAFQVSTNSRVDAYRIRWSEWPDSLSLNDLTDDTTDDACLIRHLADGWLNLKSLHETPVTVHLVTNDQPSTKKLSLSNSNNGHLAKFLATEWKQVLLSDEWSPVWSCIQGASALDESAFVNFVEHCRFTCSFTLPEHDEDDDEHQPFYWVKQLEQYFSRSVSDPYLELSQGELLQILGWRSEDAKSFLNPLHAVSSTVRDSQQSMNALRRTSEGARRQDSEQTASALDDVRFGQTEPTVTSESSPSNWLRVSPPQEEAQSSIFTGNKDSASGSREKRSWKDLAEKEKQSPLAKRFSESTTRDTTESASVKSTSRLRQLLRSQHSEADGSGDSSGFSSGIGGGPVDSQNDTGDFPHAADWLSRKARWVKEEEEEGSHPTSDPQNETGDFPQTAAWLAEPKPPEDWDESPTAGEKQTSSEAVNASSSTDERAQPITDGDSAVQIDGEGAVEGAASNEPSSSESPENDVEKPTSEDCSQRDRSPEEARQESEPLVDEDVSNLDYFSRVSRLAKRQDGIETKDETANRDAFEWYFNNGNELFAESRFADAEPEYIRALEIVGTLETPSTDEEFVILQNLGDIYLFLDKPELAVDLYERTKEMRFTTKIPSTKYIAALMKLGSDCERRNHFDNAEVAYRKAVEVAAATLEENDPIIERLNEACLQLARNRSTLLSRFSTTEVDKIRDMAKQETDVALIYRKKKTTEAEVGSSDIWKSAKKAEEEEKPPPISSKKKWTIASVAIAVSFLFAYAIFVPQSGVNIAAPRASDAGSESTNTGVVTYTSSDDRKAIRLANGSRATITTDGKAREGAYKLVRGNIQDLLAMIPGHLRHDFVFVKANKDTITDKDGTTLYANYAPEHQLVSRMWKYGALAQGYRVEKNFYPEKIEDLAISKETTSYTNPFTNQNDNAIICSTTGESTDTPVRDVIARGEGWEKQPSGAPGRIVCNTYNGRLFFIRGYDRDGKLLTSAEPGKCFYIECADGFDVSKDKLKEIQNAPQAETTEATKIQRKIRYVFTPSSEAESMFSTITSIVPAGLFALVLMAFFYWRYRIVKKIAGPFSLALFIFTTVLLLVWYIVALLDVAV
ncbi:MAG: tetratricopeptide repeat protein [Candidatus Obscuribacterales bacterium]|nr:tetratricopeptide repeat protein [Candidatus Obscuribacterales bacterium]